MLSPKCFLNIFLVQIDKQDYLFIIFFKYFTALRYLTWIPDSVGSIFLSKSIKSHLTEHLELLGLEAR